MWKHIVLLFYSLTGCNKTSFLIVRGKWWVIFLAVTGYFVKMNSLPEEPPTDCLCTIERFITVLYDCMTALTKVALYQHSFKAIYQGPCVKSVLERGNDYQVLQTVMDRTRHWNVQSTVDHHTTSIKIFSWPSRLQKYKMQLSSVWPFVLVVATLNTTFL